MVDDAEYSEKRTAKLSDSGVSPKSRRSFLGALLAVGGCFVGALLSVPLIRFALFPLLRRTTELKESPVGAVTDFSSQVSLATQVHRVPAFLPSTPYQNLISRSPALQHTLPRTATSY